MPKMQWKLRSSRPSRASQGPKNSLLCLAHMEKINKQTNKKSNCSCVRSFHVATSRKCKELEAAFLSQPMCQQSPFTPCPLQIRTWRWRKKKTPQWLQVQQNYKEGRDTHAGRCGDSGAQQQDADVGLLPSSFSQQSECWQSQRWSFTKCPSSS